jgi:hypothetical protein
MVDQNTAVWIRPEDVDHPKLDRLRRAVNVAVGARAVARLAVREARGRLSGLDPSAVD